LSFKEGSLLCLEQSEILLENFFNPDIYENLCKELSSLSKSCDGEDESNSNFIKGGPGYNIDKVRDLSDLPVMKKIYEFFESENMQILLSNWTGLAFHYSAVEDEEGEDHDGDTPKDSESKCPAKMNFSLNQLKHKSYSLLQFKPNKASSPILDRHS